jgi:hypothetical protein
MGRRWLPSSGEEVLAVVEEEVVAIAGEEVVTVIDKEVVTIAWRRWSHSPLPGRRAVGRHRWKEMVGRCWRGDDGEVKEEEGKEGGEGKTGGDKVKKCKRIRVEKWNMRKGDGR